VNPLRRGFAWAFLLATIVAQGPHDHAKSSAQSAEAEFGSCDDQHQHWAGHQPAEQGTSPELCSICQHRLQPTLVAESLSFSAELTSTSLVERGSEARLPGRPLRTRCRAPPRV